MTFSYEDELPLSQLVCKFQWAQKALTTLARHCRMPKACYNTEHINLNITMHESVCYILAQCTKL